MRKTAFKPIVTENSKILLLGTMPGEESLSKQQYYGHKSNQFWRIIYTLFNEPFEENYNKRIEFLVSKHIALWDVLAACEREGSLDSNIKNVEINDFNSFFDRYPNIRHIYFTSQKATELFKKYIKLDSNKSYTTLPSPSPANARMNFEEKLFQWKSILYSL